MPARSGPPKKSSKSREARLAALKDRWNALQEAVRMRGVEYADDPLGRTGYYRRIFKTEGSRLNPVLVEEYSLDTELLREMRALEQQLAIECGEWKDGTTIETPEEENPLMISMHQLFSREALEEAQRRAVLIEEAIRRGEKPPSWDEVSQRLAAADVTSKAEGPSDSQAGEIGIAESPPAAGTPSVAELPPATKAPQPATGSASPADPRREWMRDVKPGHWMGS